MELKLLFIKIVASVVECSECLPANLSILSVVSLILSSCQVFREIAISELLPQLWTKTQDEEPKQPWRRERACKRLCSQRDDVLLVYTLENRIAGLGDMRALSVVDDVI